MRALAKIEEESKAQEIVNDMGAIPLGGAGADMIPEGESDG